MRAMAMGKHLVREGRFCTDTEVRSRVGVAA
jgi:hypothetical protein